MTSRWRSRLGDLLLARGRVLLVLSDWFFQLGPRREGDWNDVLRGFVADNADRFAAVNLTNRALLPATAVLEPVDLWGIGEQEAERRLLDEAPSNRPPSRADPMPTPSRYPSDPPAVWGEVPRAATRASPAGRTCSTASRNPSRTSSPARPCARWSACRASGRPSSPPSTRTASAPTTTSCGGSTPTSGAPSATGSASWRRRWGCAAVRSPASGSARCATRCAAATRTAAGWVIFDGWEDVEEAAAILPRGGTGHVLITSRNHGWRTVGDIVEVPVFRRAESTGYLMRRAPHITAEEADEVAVEFQDLPLQMAHAAALLGELRMPVPEYLEKVHSGEINPLDEVSELGDYPSSSLTSWSMLFNRVRESEPRALELLKLCACFAPGRIPIGLVRGVAPAVTSRSSCAGSPTTPPTGRARWTPSPTTRSSPRTHAARPGLRGARGRAPPGNRPHAPRRARHTSAGSPRATTTRSTAGWSARSSSAATPASPPTAGTGPGTPRSCPQLDLLPAPWRAPTAVRPAAS